MTLPKVHVILNFNSTKFNMLTQFFRSINWVDVGLAIFFVRTVFVSVKSGFIAEGFKFLGTIIALFLSLHLYSPLASFLSTKTKMGESGLECAIFVLIWLAVTLIFMLLYKGMMLLFKIEANHQTVDKYAAGFLGATRGIFLTSLTVFALLLTHQKFLTHQTFASYGYKLTAKAAPNTYFLGFNALIGKVMEGQRLNEAVFAVISKHGVNPK